MTAMVGWIRGINVGGKKLPMADLVRVCEDLGYEGVRTYIQSGNVVFRTPSRSTDAVAAALEQGIAALGGVAPRVAVRTRAEVERAVAEDPFVGRGEDPAHVHLMFLTGPASSARSAPLGIDGDRFAPEEAVLVGREVHCFLPGGVGTSDLATQLARKGPDGTLRRLSTVEKVLELARGL
jgi:uncharacterized protein (DUF1697 family)